MAQEHQREAQRAAGILEPKMHVVYVLRLGADEHGANKYYAGSSCNFMNRLHNHIMGNERSAAWVRRWKYEELIETHHCQDRLTARTTEAGLAAQYKALYGWRNVCGAQDVRAEDGAQGRPAYWEPPEEGLERDRRSRSRSPGRPDAVD